MTVIALFDTHDDAEKAVLGLINLGYAREDISLMAQETAVPETYRRWHDPDESTTSAAVGGGAVGGIAGLLLGVAAIAVPGVGPVLGVGALATAIASSALGAGIGAATGSVLSMLMQAGVPDAEAEAYTEGIRRGGILVGVKTTPDAEPTVLRVLNMAGAVNIQERADLWRQDGWTGTYGNRVA